MAVTEKRVRTLALSLKGVTSYPHFDRIAFRTERRTFATLALDGSNLNFMSDLAEQQRLCELAPDAIAPVPGGWGRMGWTRIDLQKIDGATFTAVLKGAYDRANVPRTRKKAAELVKTPAAAAKTPAKVAKVPPKVVKAPVKAIKTSAKIAKTPAKIAKAPAKIAKARKKAKGR